MIKNVFVRLVVIGLLVMHGGMLRGQILEVTPVFPTIDDVVTVVYNAAEGNGALVGTSPVYAHTGVITTASATPNDWKFVIGEWATEDADVLMTDLGNDRHQIVIDIDQFYNFPDGTEVTSLAFVFRNADGTLVGRASDGGDIFYEVFEAGNSLAATLLTPSENIIVDISDEIEFSVQTSTDATITLYDNGSPIATVSDATMLDYTLTVTTGGTHEVVFVATNGGTTITDTVYYTVNGVVNIQDAPEGTELGVTYISDTEVRLKLYAPDKDFVYLIGDFNNWTARSEFYMNKSVDGTYWWIELDGLTANQRYAYQFWLDGEMRVADPLSELVLDPSNDTQIPAENYPDPHPYPFTQATSIASIMHPGKPAFNWQNNDFQRPQQNHLVIYELLIRDFVEEHNYQTLIDTLPYLKKLGINAIELMPPGEFEGNESWGYNPSFHMALDKYYGTPEMFKEFVDACHGMGIAVLVDMVLNHAFGQSPLAQMYWDPTTNKPAANNPWFNVECPHEPYCWGSDFNHYRQATQDYVDRVNKYWLEEYNVDGFRFDYTGGFTQGGGGGYDDARIGILKRMADVIWDTEPGAYITLEHWCDNSEEKQLSDYQMMLWGNVHFQYQEALMGYLGNSNFDYGLHSQRGWNWQHLITFIESHDEERAVFKLQEYGNNDGGDYDTKNVVTAMARAEMGAAFMLGQPGPKMIWQFQELGYDISIDEPCRVCNKPILWEYYSQDYRKRLYDVYAGMGYLRTNYPQVMNSGDISHNFNGAFKRINLYHPDMDVVIIGNFDVVPQTGLPNFPYTGTWYDYFGGFSIDEQNLANEFLLAPGEYRVYTSIELPKPNLTTVTNNPNAIFEVLDIELEVYPNPTADRFSVQYDLEEGGMVKLLVIDELGRTVRSLFEGEQAGLQQMNYSLGDLAAGNYHILLDVDGVANAFPIIKAQ